MARQSSHIHGTYRKKIYSTLLIIIVGLVLAASFYVAHLNQTVRVQFEGKRWALPARVYARPLELFEGENLSAAQLAAELTGLGYVATPNLDSPGTFTRSGTEFRFVTRAFRFWDTAEPSVAVHVVFDGNTISELGNTKGNKLDLVRLDPFVIGSLYPTQHEDRVLVQLKEVPPLLIKALVAVEDHRFYQHHGIDPVGLARAMWVNLRSLKWKQGASTLTQQLAKNFFLTSERSITRKVNEAIISLLLEYHYSKDEILEAYLNEIFLGQDGQRSINGFGLASYHYFGRPLSELKLPQFALLVGLAQGASKFDPRRNPKNALARRNLVLDVLATNGDISVQQAAAAKQSPLGVTTKPAGGTSAYPAFMDLVRRQLQHDYKEEDLTSEGLQIFTTLDPQIQVSAEKALAGRITELEKQFKIPADQLEGAAVVTSSQGGEVLAMVGGRDARYSGFNRALDAQRPIGSLVKPAVYLTALAQPQRYTLASLLDDSPLTVKTAGTTVWTPQNYDHQYHGMVPLHTALANSYNIPTARLGLDVGIAKVLDTLQSLGVARKFPAYSSVLLGAVELSPFEVTQVYQTLASGGFRAPLRAIRDVLTVKGEPLQRYPLSVEQAFDPTPVFLVTTAMQEVVSSGTARSLYTRLPQELNLAGKTGTTDDLRDSWFAGFSGQHVAVVWLGRDDNRSTGLSGATGALKVWGDIFSSMPTQPLRLTKPANIEYVRIDSPSGIRAGNGCLNTLELPFTSGSAPAETMNCSAAEPASGNPLDWLRGIFR